MATRDIAKEAEEQIHFQNVITAFHQYAPFMVSALVCAHAIRVPPLTSDTFNHRQLAGNNRRRKDVFTLPREDQALLDQLGYKRKLVDVDGAILTNAAFLNQIIANPAIFENGCGDHDEEAEGKENEESLDGPNDEGLYNRSMVISQTTSIHGGSRMW